MILIPKHKDIYVPLKIPVRVQGFYKIEARGADGRRRLLADWFPNLITTLGADLLGNDAPLSVCVVGSGNAAPALGDTTLQTLVAANTSIQTPNFTAQPGSPYYGTTTTVYVFDAGTATGNLSEVGVGSLSTSLFSRALILDGGGSPTTITVLSTEALYVTYQLRQYVPLVDIASVVNISGVNHNYTLRAANATTAQWAYVNGDAVGIQNAVAFDGAIGAITSSPAGSSDSADSISNVAYSTGSHLLAGTATWGITRANFGGGVTSALVDFGITNTSRGQYQVGFAVAIPKDSSHVLTLSFNTSWVINTP